MIKEDGTLQPILDVPAVQNRQSGKSDTHDVHHQFYGQRTRGENLASVVLNDPQIISRLLMEVIRIMREKGYQGLNIDFENVLPADREPL